MWARARNSPVLPHFSNFGSTLFRAENEAHQAITMHLLVRLLSAFGVVKVAISLQQIPPFSKNHFPAEIPSKNAGLVRPPDFAPSGEFLTSSRCKGWPVHLSRNKINNHTWSDSLFFDKGDTSVNWIQVASQLVSMEQFRHASFIECRKD